MSSFNLWVRDNHPDEYFLIALLIRICRTQPEKVPVEFLNYVDNKIGNLSYRISPNLSKGGCDVEFILD